MRRDEFLRTLAALGAGTALSPWARAAGNLKMMIPANPGGGWDTTGRALGKALQESGAASTVSYDNKGGAAGALGLAQFVNGSKGDPNALMVMGAVMVGGIISGKPPVNLSQATPLARLTSEYNVFVLPANSPLKSMKDVVEQLKKDPGSVKWGGGSRGSTEHIAAAMIAREVGVDPSKINYVAFRGGGEATAAILGGNVTVGGSGYSEFAEYISSGKMRALAVTSATRFPTLPEVPPIGEAVGMPELEAVSWHVIFARHDTPRDIVNRLHDEMKSIMAAPDMQEKIMRIGLIPHDTPSVEGVQRYIKAETEKWGTLVRQLGLEGSQ